MTTIPYLLTLLFSCILQLVVAQPKLSWYYPNLGEVDTRSGKNGSYQSMDVEIEGCVSGNCTAGEGRYLVVRRLSDTVFAAMSVEPILQFTLFDGTFSNEGNQFNGSVYSRRVHYDVVYRKDDPHLIPKQAADLRADEFWEAAAIGTGSMKKQGYSRIGYTWSGWMQMKVSDQAAPGQPTSYKAYFDEEFVYANIEYAPGGAYRHVEGRVLPGGEFLGGRIQFEDGSMYEGFLYHGKLFGPGRFLRADGKTEEGIWINDSLQTPMKVKFPKAFFAPGTNEELASFTPLYGGKRMLTDTYYDAGDGWIFASGGKDVFLGQTDANGFNGVGFWLSIRSGNSRPPMDVYTYRIGNFQNGNFQSGTRLKDVATGEARFAGSNGFLRYIKTSASMTVGNFANDALSTGCATIVGLDANFNPATLFEGMFFQDQNGSEVASGWAYVDDWLKERDAAHLMYAHNGQNYLQMSDAPVYASWFEQGAKNAHSAPFCFPEMETQAPGLLLLIDQRAAEVKARNEQIAAELAAAEARWETYKAECQQEASRYPYHPGQLLKMKDGSGRDRCILIQGDYSCQNKTFPVILQNWQSTTAENGYFRAGNSHMDVNKLSGYVALPGTYALCPDCQGRCTMPATSYCSVGGNSGYTYVGGGWMVKNPETYWKNEYMAVCGKCAGLGFIPK